LIIAGAKVIAMSHRFAALGGLIASQILITCLHAQTPSSPDRNIGMAVTVVKATNKCLDETVMIAGTVVAKDEILVRPEREGLQITQILVEPGEAVTAGQALARLLPPEGQPGPRTASDVQAPAAGVVIASAAVVGATASARAEPLFRILARGELEFAAEVPIKQAFRIAAGQKSTIHVEGTGELTSEVSNAFRTIDSDSQLARIRLLIGRNQNLRVGSFGRATINVGRTCGISLPLSAVLYQDDATVVQVVRAGRIETRQVSIATLVKGEVLIREGLTANDVVVSKAGSFLREGDRVREKFAGS
jgi:multidrug efflux pump subunit AcrA (membrane-fusion protein)